MILHVDMDAYYASVEQRDNPKFLGKPVIVGGSAEGRGVVCAASYEARKFGVHSAMPAATARRLCPAAIFLRPRMEHYATISRQIGDIFNRYTPLIEPLSLDEAFLDVSGSQQLFGSAPEIGARIKSEIRDELQLTASVGIASNKFLAKIASDLRKPDALVIVDSDRIQSFLDPLPVGRLWGVGRVTDRRFDQLGIRTIAQLRALKVDTMRELFGEHGEHLWRLARGIDDRSVVPDRQAKSISHETTFAADISDRDVIQAWLLELSDQLGRRLRRCDLDGRTLHLKIRFSDFKTLTRAMTLDEPTNSTQTIYESSVALYRTRIAGDHPPVRLLGVGMSRFERPDVRQTSLFDEAEKERCQKIDEAADQIREKFGHHALSRGSRLLHNTRHREQPRPNEE